MTYCNETCPLKPSSCMMVPPPNAVWVLAGPFAILASLDSLDPS